MKRTVKVKTCKCRETNKIKHFSTTQAEMHIRKLEIRAENIGVKQGGMIVYRCRYCNAYHIGHKLYNKQYTTIK